MSRKRDKGGARYPGKRLGATTGESSDGTHRATSNAQETHVSGNSRLS